MRATDVPLKFPIPFAGLAAPGFIRPIPLDSQVGITNGAASLTDGFPPETFTPVLAGGTPPWGADVNGILNQTTAWDRWAQAGAPVFYDPAFQAAIGGYPAATRVRSAVTPNLIWQSTAEDNLSNPDLGGAGWSVPILADPNVAGLRIAAATASGANLRLEGNGAVTPNKTLRANNGLFEIINNAYSASVLLLTDQGDLTVTGGANVGGSATVNGQIVAGTGLYAGTAFSPNAFNGREWQFMVDANGDKIQAYRADWYDYWSGQDGSRGWVGPAGTLMWLDGVGNFGAHGNITAGNELISAGARIIAVGAANEPSVTCWDTAQSAAAGMLLAAGNQLLFTSMTGAGGNAGQRGSFDAAGNFAAMGMVTAVNGILQAAYGVRDNPAGANGDCGVLLKDFWPSSFGRNGYTTLPNGLIIQWGESATPNGVGVLLPTAFPNAFLVIVLSESEGGGAWFADNVVSAHAASILNNWSYDHFSKTYNGTRWDSANNSCMFIAIGF